MDPINLPRIDVAALQVQIKEYVALLGVIKSKKNDLKELSTTLKNLADEIRENMMNNNIPSCSSAGYTFSVKEKTKMKSASAKTFLVGVKEFFRISDEDMAKFMDVVETRRRQSAEVVEVLECKAAKKKKDAEHENENELVAGDISDAPTLTQSIDDIYD